MSLSMCADSSTNTIKIPIFDILGSLFALFGIVQCGAVQCSAVQCSAVQCSALHLKAAQVSAVECSV